MAVVINLFGGPGCGKSTGAAYVFSKLKMLGVNAELTSEYAKDKTAYLPNFPEANSKELPLQDVWRLILQLLQPMNLPVILTRKMLVRLCVS